MKNGEESRVISGAGGEGGSKNGWEKTMPGKDGAFALEINGNRGGGESYGRKVGREISGESEIIEIGSKKGERGEEGRRNGGERETSGACASGGGESGSSGVRKSERGSKKVEGGKRGMKNGEEGGKIRGAGGEGGSKNGWEKSIPVKDGAFALEISGDGGGGESNGGREGKEIGGEREIIEIVSKKVERGEKGRKNGGEREETSGASGGGERGSKNILEKTSGASANGALNLGCDGGRGRGEICGGRGGDRRRKNLGGRERGRTNGGERRERETSGAGGGVRKGRRHAVSRSSRAEIVFPVGRIDRFLRKGLYSQRIGSTSSVYLSAVLQYLTREVLELAGNEVLKGRINPRHIKLAVKKDEELSALLGGVVIAGGGCWHPIATVSAQRKDPLSSPLNN